MYPFDGLLKDLTPATFNPKVTPDPTESERLAEKLREATEQLRVGFKKNFTHRTSSGYQTMTTMSDDASNSYGRPPNASW